MHQDEQVTSHIVWLKWRLLLFCSSMAFNCSSRACGLPRLDSQLFSDRLDNQPLHLSDIVFGLSFDQAWVLSRSGVWVAISPEALNELISTPAPPAAERTAHPPFQSAIAATRTEWQPEVCAWKPW